MDISTCCVDNISFDKDYCGVSALVTEVWYQLLGFISVYMFIAFSMVLTVWVTLEVYKACNVLGKALLLFCSSVQVYLTFMFLYVTYISLVAAGG